MSPELAQQFLHVISLPLFERLVPAGGLAFLIAVGTIRVVGGAMAAGTCPHRAFALQPFGYVLDVSIGKVVLLAIRSVLIARLRWDTAERLTGALDLYIS